MQFLVVDLGPFEFGVCGGSGWWFCCWQMIFFLQPKPRRSDGDEEGFICCVPPSSFWKAIARRNMYLSIHCIINPICHDYSPNANNIFNVGAHQIAKAARKEFCKDFFPTERWRTTSWMPHYLRARRKDKTNCCNSNPLLFRWMGPSS